MRRAALKYDLIYCIVKSIPTVNYRSPFFRPVPCLIAVALDRIRAQRILSLDIPVPVCCRLSCCKWKKRSARLIL
jgi:hypothetical protein